MALIVSSQLDALAESIVPALPKDPSAEQTAAREAAFASTRDLVEKVCQYIVDQLEINGIKETLDVSLNTIFTAGVPAPTDGGLALQTAWKAATTGGIADDSTQNNDGKGRVL